MGILEQLLSEIKTPDLTQQVREICDKITEQEQSKQEYTNLTPKGATVFLSLEAPGRNDKEVGFLSLEREDEETYVIVYHTIEKHRIDPDDPELISPRRRKVWVVNEIKAEKILTAYAKKLKMLRGE
ncbi:MAG: hypothetical protein ACFFG0_01885 [Candidatus Thorarchaeota archaeon]